MQVKYNDGNIAHVQNDVGRALIAAKLAVEIPSEVKRLVPDTTWIVRPGEGKDRPPFLYAYCATCSHKAMLEGPTVHKTGKFHHAVPCGAPESCPPDVAKEYIKTLADFKSGTTDRSPSYGVSASQQQIEQDRRDRMARAAGKL